MNALQTQPEVYPFFFDQIRLKEACWIDDKPYFTRRAIGEWLGAKRPRYYVRDIVERNPHIKVFSRVRNLRTHETTKMVTREVEMYDPIGFQLILMKSNLPKAIQYQIAVAHLVYAFMRGEISQPRNTGDLSFLAACENLLRIPTSQKRGRAVLEVAKKHNRSKGLVYRWMQRIRQGENPAIRKPHYLKGTHLYINKEDAAAIRRRALESPMITAKEIVRDLPRVDCTCSSLATVQRIKRRALEAEAPSNTCRKVS